MEKMSKALHCSKDTLLGEFEKLSDELKRAESEKRSLKSEVAEYEIQNMLNSSDLIKDIRVIKTIFNNVDLKYINLLATKLASHSNVIVLFAAISEDKAQLIFMRSKELNIISMNSLLKDAITLIDGKGGGSDFSAQGGGKNNNNLNSTIDYAYKRVKDSIMSK
jgi:alanyl-tRNA synthetase